jgi:hypothetical protein
MVGEVSDDPPLVSGKKRLSWERMDWLKARMVREGYPVPEVSPSMNEAVRYSRAKRVRRPQLHALLGMTAEQIDTAVRDLRGMRTVATGKG